MIIALDFPHRALLITMTYGVVILSLPVQGLTMLLSAPRSLPSV